MALLGQGAQTFLRLFIYSQIAFQKEKDSNYEQPCPQQPPSTQCEGTRIHWHTVQIPTLC